MEYEMLVLVTYRKRKFPRRRLGVQIVAEVVVALSTAAGYGLGE